MTHRAFRFEPTPEDVRTIRTWKWRVAAVYGVVLLALIVLVARNPRPSEIAYAILAHLWSVFLLHALLLPINLFKLARVRIPGNGGASIHDPLRE